MSNLQGASLDFEEAVSLAPGVMQEKACCVLVSEYWQEEAVERLRYWAHKTIHDECLKFREPAKQTHF